MDLKKVLLSLAVVCVVLIGGYGVSKLGTGTLGGGRLNQYERTVFSTSTNADYTGLTVIPVNEFRNVGVTLAGTNASGTVRFACSTQDEQPSFATTSKTATNRWDYVEIVDLEDGATIDGDTGVVLANTTDVRQFEINSNNFRWCTAILTGNTSPFGLGTSTVFFRPVDNS